jgi:hypothetical protein
MKKILAVLIAALMICLTFVPAQAATLVDFLPYAKLICEAIKTFSTAGADIHKAYADTLKQAMDYRMYYNQQGLAKAYDKMQVSMRNTGTPSYKSVLNTTNNTFYDMSRDYTYTYNTAYYNQTYNSYYIPVTYNNVDYNYFVTYTPTYTNITYIVDGCGDPSQAVSNNYYFQLPDGRNSYNLTADDVFGIPLAGEVINYDAVPENDNCVALYHFDGNIVDVSGNGNTAKFADGTVPQYISSSSFGKHLMLTNRGRFSLTLPEALEAPYTIEFRLNYGQYQSFFPISSELGNGYERDFYISDRRVTHSGSSSLYYDNQVFIKALKQYLIYHNKYSFYFSGLDEGARKNRFGYYWETGGLYFYDFPSVTSYYAKDKSGNFVTISTSLLSSNYDTCFIETENKYSAEKLTGQSFNYGSCSSNSSIPILLGQWVNMAIVNDGSTVKYYMNGVEFTPPSNWVESTGSVDYLSFYGSPGFTYSYYDELRISKGALYTENYTPASAPFDIPMALVLPSEKTEGAIAVKSAVAVNNVRLGGVRPSYPAQGDVYISLDADKKVTSCQQYQSGTWTECQGSVCKDGNWVELTGYSFAGQVVNEDDFAEVVDKKDDPAIGSNSNPDAEVTSFTVHYYKDGTTDKLRRDTVYQNVAVGSSFTFSPPAIKNYKPLVSSAEITISADGEHVFYYAADAGSGGGSGGESDPSKPGFFDGLLSGVKSLVNVVCGFLGGVVQSVLSGITGIISTLIDAFKAVLSLGGHFGDFLAAALGFVPREIIDLLIAGIAVSIALAIVKFIRG